MIGPCAANDVEAPDRPIVHCLAAYIWLHPDGTPKRLSSPIVITLQDAPWFIARGYWVLGPDVEDVIALAKYERETDDGA